MKLLHATVLVATIGCARTPERVSALPFYRSATLSPEWLPAAEAESRATHRIARFAARDQQGRVFTEAAFAGKLTIAHFFFTSCGDVCPTTTRNIGSLLAELPAERVQVFSYSVLPEHDSISVLRRYAASHHVTDERWHFLVTDGPVIRRLATESFFVRLGADTTYGVKSIAHTESLVLIDGRRRIRGIYAGTLAIEMQRLQEDVRTLLREGAE